MAPRILAFFEFGPKRLPASVMKTPSSSTWTFALPTSKEFWAITLLPASCLDRDSIQDKVEGVSKKYPRKGKSLKRPTKLGTGRRMGTASRTVR
jgi:hypothetical protein